MKYISYISLSLSQYIMTSIIILVFEIVYVVIF